MPNVQKVIYLEIEDLIRLFKRNKRSCDTQLDKMKKLSYTQEEINDIGAKMYKETCRKIFEKHRCDGKMDKIQYKKLIKQEEFKRFWRLLKKTDEKLYGRALLYFK